MKKLLSLLLVCVLAVGLIGCGSAAETAKAPASPQSGHKTLIVYFSYTGNTRALAAKIHDRIGGDMTELELKEPYSTEYKRVEQQGKEEVEQGFMPELAGHIEDFGQYDTIVVGTPVWWYHMTPAVASFLNQYDFTGKTVLPFVTHGGWPGTAAEDIAKAAKGAHTGPALVVKGQDVSRSDGQIDDWLASAGLMK